MSFNGYLLKHHQHLLQLFRTGLAYPSLKTAKSLHALIITLGSSPTHSTFLYNNMLSLYVLLKEIPMAYGVFENMRERNSVSYNSIISSYSKCDCSEEAWSIFREMMDYGFRPNHFTLAGLLSCASMDLICGLQMQALAMKNGLFCADAFVGTALLGWFEKHGWLDEAFRVFKNMPSKSLVTWNSMIYLCGRHGFTEDCMLLFIELFRKKDHLSESTFVAVLSAIECEHDLEFGKQIHGLIIKNGFDSEVSVVNSIINMYVKSGKIHIVLENMFEGEVSKDIVTWNTIIGALAKSEKPSKALEFFLKMSEDGVRPNLTTFVSLIKSSTSSQIPMCGEIFHAKAIVTSFKSDVYVGSALVDYYARCNKLNDAHCCFIEIDEKNVVSWNALILGYANKCSPGSIYLLKDMLQYGYRPNEISFSTILKSTLVFELYQLHSLIIRMGYENNEHVLSSLITSYDRNVLISDALIFVSAFDKPLSVVPSNSIAGIYNRSGNYLETLKLLSQLEEPDLVSWNIVIAACSRNGNYKEVFELFKHMLLARIHPDDYTYVSLLCVCGNLCDLRLGSAIHALMVKNNFNLWDVFVCNMLINMYGKCGSPGNSVKIFKSMEIRNLITWTVLISALGLNGCTHEALERFKEMESMGFIPDKVAFISVLTACKHGGLVREGMELFEKMNAYKIEPEQDHYHCIVDLLASHGHLKEAEKIISRMPCPPNALIWRCFLGGCKRHDMT